MKLISWNIAGKVKGCEAHANALNEFSPDLIALQEVRANASKTLRSTIQENGLSFILDTTEITTKNKRQYGVLIASRWPVIMCSEQFDIPYLERSLSVEIDHPAGKIELHTVHVPPGSSNGWIKIETLEGVYQALSKPLNTPTILCGDFNTPKIEFPNGEIVTWGQRVSRSGKVSVKRGFERWDLGERNIVQGLEEAGFINVFRGLHGYEKQEISWERRIHGKQHGYRYDHMFATKSLYPIQCEYLHELRERGLSDHSPISAKFQIE